MNTGNVPVKTELGLDEIAHRTRRLSQRHRTVLLLVDGRRDEAEVVSLAARAGVPEACFRELVDQGLVMRSASAPDAPASVLAASTSSDDGATPPVPLRSAFVRSGMAPLSDSAPGALDDPVMAPVAAITPAVPSAVQASASNGAIVDAWADAHADSLSPAAMYASRFSVSGLPTSGFAPSQSDSDSLLPAMRTLAPDSTASGFGDSMGRAGEDRPLEEARDLLIRAVTREAPVAGSLTLIRLRRAGSREELQRLLDEVESRISRPRNRDTVEQTLRRARHLLGLSSRTSFLVSR